MIVQKGGISLRRASLLLLILLLLFGIAPAEETITFRDGAWTVAEGIEDLDDARCEALESRSLGLYSLRLPSTLRSMGYYNDLLFGFNGVSLTIPEGVTEFYVDLEYSYLRRLTLPSTVIDLSRFYFDEDLQFIRIAEDNPALQVIDNVVFSKDGKTLILYPPGKTDVHYAVPNGVTTIACGAFWENDHLRSLSLPFGLTTLEENAIDSCGRLESVAVPLTLCEVGPYCFSDCVSLSRISLPPDLKIPEGWFSNCPLLPFGKKYTPYDSAYRRRKAAVSRVGLVSPEDQAGAVDILDAPEDAGDGIMRLGCGEALYVTGENGDYYAVTHEAWDTETSGYVLKSLIALQGEYEPLFAYETVMLKENRVFTQSVYSGDEVLPENLCEIVLDNVLGQWLECNVCYVEKEYEVEDGRIVEEYPYYTITPYRFWIGDAVLRRAWTGDDRTFGIVLTDSPQARAPLFAACEKGSPSLGRYFSGTQVEVTDARDGFLAVQLSDGTAGFMMQEDVTIIEQEAF